MRSKGILKKSILAAALAIFMMQVQVSAATDLIVPGPDAIAQTGQDQKSDISQKKSKRNSGKMALDGDGASNLEEENTKAETILIRAETRSLVLGRQYQFTVNAYPKTAGDVPVSWRSSNPIVASVDEQGIVSAGREGSAAITVSTTDGTNLSDTITVKVGKEKIIVLDPGHGGQDSGAVSRKYGLVERNMNLDIALACKAKLEEYEGVKVYLTRSTNSYYPSLSARPRLAYEKKADLFLSLHINDGAAYSNGAEVYQSVNGRYQRTGLAREILNQLSSLGIKNRGVKMRRSASGKDYYAVIRGSAAYGIPGMIIEHGFINNKKDAARMDTRTERKALGEADGEAIASYLNLSKKGLALSDSASAFVYVTKVKAESSSVILNEGAKRTVKVKVIPEIATDKSLTWHSSDPSIVTVSSRGEITAIKKGIAYVTAKAADGSGEKARIKVVVRKLVQKISLKTNQKIVKQGKKVKLVPTISPKDATVKTLAYTSSNRKAVSVNKKGIITAKKKGAAIVTIKAQDGSKKNKKIKIIVR